MENIFFQECSGLQRRTCMSPWPTTAPHRCNFLTFRIKSYKYKLKDWTGPELFQDLSVQLLKTDSVATTNCLWRQPFVSKSQLYVRDLKVQKRHKTKIQ